MLATLQTPEQLRLNVLSRRIIGAAMRVHTALGCGLLESAYEACLAYELVEDGLHIQSQVPLPLVYRTVRLECLYRMDVLVEDSIILELKTVDAILPVHEAQLLSYLKLSDKRLGLLLNFHAEHLRDGIRRVVNDF